MAQNPQHVFESDLHAHLWLEIPRFYSGPSNMNPITTDTKEFLAYWHERVRTVGTASAIEKAIRYMAPRTKTLFSDATAMSLIRHKRDDWDLFKDTVARVFQVNKSDMVEHPLRHRNWLIQTRPKNALQGTPRNQTLQMQTNLALRPLNQLSSMVFDANKQIKNATYVKMRVWLKGMKLIPDAIPVTAAGAFQQGCGANDQAKVFLITGMAIALTMRAYQDFKYHNMPAGLIDMFDDVLEQQVTLTDGNDICLVTGLSTHLATFLTTQNHIKGPAQADLDRNGKNGNSSKNGNKSQPTMAVTGNQDQEETAAVNNGNKNKRGKRRGNGGNNAGNNSNSQAHGSSGSSGKGKVAETTEKSTEKEQNTEQKQVSAVESTAQETLQAAFKW